MSTLSVTPAAFIVSWESISKIGSISSPIHMHIHGCTFSTTHTHTHTPTHTHTHTHTHRGRERRSGLGCSQFQVLLDVHWNVMGQTFSKWMDIWTLFPPSA